MDKSTIMANGKDKNEEDSRKNRPSVLPRHVSVIHNKCSFQFIAENVIGKDAAFKSPFGVKKAIYCDYTASGKPLACIENYIRDHVYTYYANTHTTTNISALQTTLFREEARTIIKKCVNASEEDVVIFSGSGVTGAIHKLIHVMNVKENASKTAVIIGPYEHHSNILPWKENGCLVDRISETDESSGKHVHGQVNMEMLEERLKKHSKDSKLIIVAMSAASNVTGILTDTVKIAELTHKYGAISLWDYATAAPYVKIDMNPSANSYKDAVFISPHKFVGGVGTPGILIAKKKLFINPVPSQCGGGTVVWVTKQTHEYHTNIEEREEGGTPAIIESIRAGLTFQIKDAIGEEEIEQREHELAEKAFHKWRNNSNIALLGSHQAKRLPIFSFLIIHPESGKYLHHNFVSILLNDLYGIQVRGGCACAGPYAQDLLCMSESMARKFANFLSEHKSDKEATESLGIMKPGFTRLNLPYFFDDDTINYILEAVDQVAIHGWMLLPLYTYDAHTGDWHHREHGLTTVRSLMDITYSDNKITVPASQTLCRESTVTLAEMLHDASTVIEHAKNLCHIPKEEDPSLIWFLEPKQAHLFLTTPGLKNFPFIKSNVPFMNRRNTQIRAKNRIKAVLVKAKKEGLMKAELNFISDSQEWNPIEDEYTTKQRLQKQKNKVQNAKCCTIM